MTAETVQDRLLLIEEETAATHTAIAADVVSMVLPVYMSPTRMHMTQMTSVESKVLKLGVPDVHFKTQA